MHHSSIYAGTATFNTGAGLNLVDRSLLWGSWRKLFRPAVKLLSKLGLNHHVQIEGTMKLVVLLSDLPACVTFGVVDNFVIPIWLGTSCIDRFISRIFPLERQIVPSTCVQSLYLHRTPTKERQMPWLPNTTIRTITTYSRHSNRKQLKPKTSQYQFKHCENAS